MKSKDFEIEILPYISDKSKPLSECIEEALKNKAKQKAN